MFFLVLTLKFRENNSVVQNPKTIDINEKVSLAHFILSGCRAVWTSRNRQDPAGQSYCRRGQRPLHHRQRLWVPWDVCGRRSCQGELDDVIEVWPWEQTEPLTFLPAGERHVLHGKEERTLHPLHRRNRRCGEEEGRRKLWRPERTGEHAEPAAGGDGRSRHVFTSTEKNLWKTKSI